MTVTTISTRARYQGCLLAGAAGDALGAAIEFLSLAEIRAEYGATGLTDFAFAFGRCGSITDDSQLTLATGEGLLRAVVRYQLQGLCSVEEVVNHSYLRWLLMQGFTSKCKGIGTDGLLYGVPELHNCRSPGRTCITALTAKTSFSDLYAANSSSGCGAVMRSAPVGLIFGGDSLEVGIPKAFELGCNLGKLTHGGAAGYLSAGVMAVLVLQLVHGRDLPEALKVAMGLLDTGSAGGKAIWSTLTTAQALAGSSTGADTAIAMLGEGWNAGEALSLAVFCALRAHTLEEALVLAVNHSGDSDSVGSITGNIMGAWRGADAIPQRWLQGLELQEVIQTVADDLLDSAEWELCLHEDTPESKVVLEKYPGW